MASSRTDILRTDAVVLRSTEYGETSRIVNLLTRDHGRVGVMARGARSPKSRFGSTLEPMSWIQAVIHFRPGRDLQTLSESSHVEVFSTIGRSLERLGVGIRTIELTGALMQSGQPSPSVLQHQVDTLRMLNTAERVDNVWPVFAMRLAGILGFSPSFTRERVEQLPAEGGWLQLDGGQVAEYRPAGTQGVKASRSALRAFAVCTRADPAVALRMSMDDRTASEVNALVDAFIEYHVEDSFPHRTARVLGQLNG
ncbi:MAG: DNA repair protein RecO [Rhodothermales bacterium]|nr:DNA repair protein RecO [Rhodothermales bacterium]